MPAVMQELGWKTSCGCPTCRPALNYYLLCAWPGEYRDDAQSRFINERVHANIQKDGTFSVVPRMWGGADHARRAARHRRRRRQVRHPDGQGHRRPAHRPARRAQGGPAGGLGRPQRRRHGLRPRLRQGPAHGEDLRRHATGAASAPRIRPGSASSSSSFMWGSWTPAKVKLGGLRLPAQLRRGDLQGHRHRSASTPATRSTSPAPPACTSRAPSCSARSRPRRRRSSSSSRVDAALSRAGATISSGSTSGSTRVGLECDPARRSWTTREAARRCYDRFELLAARSRRSIPGPSAPRAASATSSCRSPSSRCAEAAE